MMTIIFETTRGLVEQYASEHLADPVIRTSGRMVAVQSPTLEELGEVAIRDLAEAYNLPLRGVEHRRPFASRMGPPQRRARPGARRRVLREG